MQTLAEGVLATIEAGRFHDAAALQLATKAH
jgi:hypothetical protein